MSSFMISLQTIYFWLSESVEELPVRILDEFKVGMISFYLN
jgi:hypothetical protein